MRELEPGDVIQIKPEENMTRPDVEPEPMCFQGCLAIVGSVTEQGVVANVLAPIPGAGRLLPAGIATIRLERGTYVYIGVSVYHMGTRDDI